MDPRSFVRISVGALGLIIPITSKSTRSGVHELSSPCLYEVRLKGFSAQTTSVPKVTDFVDGPDLHGIAARFYLEKADLCKLSRLFPVIPSLFGNSDIYRKARMSLGSSGSNQIGTFKLQVGPEWGEGKAVQIHNGWTSIGESKAKGGGPRVELHIIIRIEPDP